jgi:multiple sugar transport system ATP-binding protein
MADVTLTRVSKVFGQTPVLHGVDLAIRSGEFVVFVGPSGCGKSTLLRMIAGLESLSGGEIRIGDRTVNDLPPRDRDIAMVFQDYALYPHKSVYDNMAFGLKLRRRPEAEIRRKVDEAAAILQIGHLLDRRPRQLSGGQRQRVAMGRAIVRDPKAFLFDEPLSNLDALLRSEMRIEIKKLHQRLGTTSIYVTHDQVEAMTLADRIVVLQGGRIMQIGTPDEIYNRPAHRFVAGFTGAPPMNFVAATVAEDGAALALDGGIRLPVPPRHRARTAAAAAMPVSFGLRPEHIGVVRPGEGAIELDAEVVLVEPLGADTLGRLKLGANELTGRFPPDARLVAGSTIRVGLALDHMHLFDPGSGAALLQMP